MSMVKVLVAEGPEGPVTVDLLVTDEQKRQLTDAAQKALLGWAFAEEAAIKAIALGNPALLPGSALQWPACPAAEQWIKAHGEEPYAETSMPRDAVPGNCGTPHYEAIRSQAFRIARGLEVKS